MARIALTGRLSWAAGLLIPAALMMALPRPSNAGVITAVQCAVQVYPCPGGAIIASGTQTNFVNVIGANQFSILNYNFGNAAVSYSGTVMGTDIAGTWIYLWGSGTVTDKLGGALVLDVAFQQNYLTFAGPAVFNDAIVGGCGGGVGANSGAIGQGIVNATGLSVLIGNCSTFNPFVVVGNAVGGAIGNLTTLTGAAQFVFTAGSAAGSTVTLPWGDDFPDPALNFNDPNNPLNLIDPADDAGLGLTSAATPEPATFTLFGGALCLAGLLRRRKRA